MPCSWSALNRETAVSSKKKDLIAEVESQPAAFKVQWSFAGTKWIVNHKTFPAKRAWLVELFTAMEGENREVIVKKLRAAAENFKN